MSEIVLDSSAVLAHMNGEPGAEALQGVFGRAVVSTVNLAEIVTKLSEWRVPEPIITEALSRYGLKFAAFDEDQARRAGLLRAATKAHGLSLGDRACLALAVCLDLPVVTADKAWQRVELPVEVRLLPGR